MRFLILALCISGILSSTSVWAAVSQPKKTIVTPSPESLQLLPAVNHLNTVFSNYHTGPSVDLDLPKEAEGK